ncbi:MAG: ABC transporter substrate-binding protein [Treponema sp.]|nr:ABC transporter substrate-binding protein [Treponema sp.]MCL2272034.1 ABC transporter substrate-binding protein [Treponema sp.]
MKRIIAAVCSFFIIFFASCSGKDIKNNEFLFGFVSEPSTFDPISPASTADGRSILFNIFEGLVKPDTTGDLKPCLAQSWTIDEDLLAYNFTLREGVLFHDGSPLVSADVKFSFDTAVASGFSGLDNIKEVLTEGNNRVRLVLKNPDPEFLPYITLGIVKNGNNDREKNICGTGPFSFESYTTQRRLVLKRFDNYWHEKKASLEKVIIVFFENYDALMTALQSESISGSRVTGSMAALLDQKRFDFVSSYSASVQLLALNNAFPPLDDVRVRRAINYGIDIKNIIDTAFFGAGVPSGSPIIPGLSLYYDNSLVYDYNPDLARSLLKQAGFDGEINDFSLEITVPSNYAMHVDTAQVIANQLEKIGVSVNIRLVDWNTWLSDTYQGRNYQSTIISLDSPNVSPRSYLSRYNSQRSNNFINFKNDEFDRVYSLALVEPDEKRRINYYKNAQRIIAESAASVYIQDIFYFMTLKAGQYSGVLNYPLYVIDFASIHRINQN